jgi:hypothetical protein
MGPDAEALRRLDARLERIEALLTQERQVLAQAPAAIAMAGDLFDDTVDRLSERGVDVDARAQAALRLLEAASDPRTLAVLEAALRRPERLEALLSLADQAPGVVSMTVDVVDGWIERAMARGLDPAQLGHRVLDLLERLAHLATSPQIDALLSSGVLDPNTLETLGQLATAVAGAGDEASRPVGLFGAIRAGREARVQRALGFGVSVARRFGALLERPKNKLTDANR